MQKIILTAKQEFDLRYTFDEILDSNLGLPDDSFDIKTREGRGAFFAGGDRPMLTVELHFRIPIDDRERLRLMEELRRLVGSDADISFKDG